MISNILRKLLPRVLRNWLRSPAKSISYVRDRLAFANGTRGKVSPADGWYVVCHPAATHHFEVFKQDLSQMEELRGFVSHCNPEMRLLDVGAHYGLFSLACCHYSGSSAKVVCVEASAKASAVLKENLKLNEVKDSVSVVNCAIGGIDGELEMLSTGPLGGDYFVSPSEKRSDTTKVPQLTLESILQKTAFKPTHIKMDIESFEYEAIYAGREYLAKNRPILFLEIHGTILLARGKEPSQIVDWLDSIGYDLWSPDGESLLDKSCLEKINYDCRVIAKGRTKG